jgi:two-component system KDP operon response regulator KdpE
MNESTKKRILLADNSTEYRRSMRGLLQLEGYLVEEAASPLEALDKLHKFQFDLILVEARLRDEDDPKDLSGLEIAKEASEHDIPTIIVTAFPTVELARNALRSSTLEPPLARDFITKVSGPQNLLDSIRRILIEPKNPALPRLALDVNRRLVWKDGELLQLSKSQYLLLETLFKKEGAVGTYVELIRAIYGEDVADNLASNDTRLRNLIDRTKAKIEDPGTIHQHLQVIPGRGLRLNFAFAGDPTTDAPPPKKKKDK